MSTPVTYVGTQYNVPAYQDTGYAQGAGNLSSYLIAMATGSLTLSGGTFPLTADANFGGSFGLVALYYKSRTASIATSGQIRLAATDSVSFSTSNYALSTDGSGNLTWRGAAIATSAGAVTSITGTANQITASAAVGAVTLSLPSAISLSGVTNQLVLGTTRTVTVSAPTPAVSSRTVTLPDLSADYSVVGTAGAQTIGGAKTFSSAIAITATSAHMVLSTAVNTLTIQANSQATSPRTWSVPDVSGNGTFAALEGAQTFSGAKTFSATLTMSAATIAMGANKITGLAAASANGDAVRWEQILGFRILQIVTASTTSVATSTTTVFADTNLTATITPTLSTSKVLVLVSQSAEASGGNGVTVCSLQLLRAGSIIFGPNAAAYQAAVIANDIFSQYPIVVIDSPATTSATIYKTQFARGAGTGTASVNDTFNAIASISTIMLIEIG